MQQVQMGIAIDIPLPTLQELAFRIDLEGLPLGTTLPPLALPPCILAKPVLPTVISAEVARDDVLKRVSYLMGSGGKRVGSSRIEVERTTLIIHTRTRRTPCIGVMHKQHGLVGVQRGRVARLRKAQLLCIHRIHFLRPFQQIVRVEPVRIGILRRVIAKTCFPEHNKMLRLLRTGKAILALLAVEVIPVQIARAIQSYAWVGRREDVGFRVEIAVV